MQEICFSISSLIADGAGKIYVEVNGINSNELDITVRNGNIFFVRNNGDNTNGTGVWNNAWKTLDFVGSGASDLISAGDIIYADGITDTTGFIIGVSDTKYFAGTASHLFINCLPRYKCKNQWRRYPSWETYNL